MSLERFLRTNSSAIPKAAQPDEVKTQLEKAIGMAQLSLSDKYDQVAIFSCHWADDDTQGHLDCKLFSTTMSSMAAECTASKIYSILADETLLAWLSACDSAMVSLDKSKRTLFIFHYSGHATKSSTSSSLVLTALNEDDKKSKLSVTQRDFTRMNEFLLEASLCYPLMDVLMVVDSCCAAVGGRGAAEESGRVEFVAATTETGTANARQDGQTFTEAWCHAVEVLRASHSDFTTDDIIAKVNDNRDLAQYPRLFVKHQGGGLPITFFNYSDNDELARRPPRPIRSQFVLTAFHLAESPSDDSVATLINYLAASPIPVSIVAAVPVDDSTLLLIELPALLLNFLRNLKQSSVVLWPLSKTVDIGRNICGEL